MCWGTVPRYTKLPDYAKCSDDDKDEAENILVAATEAASMYDGRTDVENSANTDVSKAVSKATKITDVANATNNDGARIDILPPSPTNVSGLFDAASSVNLSRRIANFRLLGRSLNRRLLARKSSF